MKNHFRTSLDFLSKSNLFISFGSFLSVLGAFGFAKAQTDWSLAGFVFFATLFTYHFQRRVGDLKEDGFSWFGLIFMLLGSLGLVFFGFRLEEFQIIVLTLAGLISLAYAYPFIPSPEGKLSLRLLPGLKLWIIVFVWTVSCAFLPVFSSATPVFIVLFVLQQASFVTALTVPFDIRDLPVDLPRQKTLPQVLGVQKARNIALTCLVFSAATAISLFFLEEIEMKLLLGHFFVLGVSWVVVRKAKTSNSELYFFVAVDGMLILQGLVFFIIR